MSGGFLKLWRSLLSWEHYNNPSVKVVFLDLLLNANWESSEWAGITLPRGALFTSTGAIAKRNGLSTMQVRWALKKLSQSAEIQDVTYNKGKKILIQNFDKFQEPMYPQSRGYNNATNNANNNVSNNANNNATNPQNSHELEDTAGGDNVSNNANNNVSNNANNTSYNNRERMGKNGEDSVCGELTHLTHSSDFFKKVWEEWLAYRVNDLGYNNYKSKRTERKALKVLQTLSDGDPEKAQKIVNQAMEGEYPFFRPLPQAKKNGKQVAMAERQYLNLSYQQKAKYEHPVLLKSDDGSLVRINKPGAMPQKVSEK